MSEEHFPKVVDTTGGAREVRETKLPFEANLTRTSILELLRHGGTENQEAMSQMLAWIDEQQSFADQDPTGRRRILLEIARADFYLAIGDKAGAIGTLEDACTMAQQEGNFDLLDIAEEKIQIVEGLD